MTGSRETPEATTSAHPTLPMDAAEQVELETEPASEEFVSEEAAPEPEERRSPRGSQRMAPEAPPPLSSAPQPPPHTQPPPMLPGSVEALSYKPASPRSVEQAVLEVKRVVDGLLDALHDMEEVLELIEDAEQQKVADEREIARLQELLRQVTQVRERLPAATQPERYRRDRHESTPSKPQASAPSPQTAQQPHHPSGHDHGGHGHGGSSAGAGEDRQGGNRRRRRGRGRGRGRQTEQGEHGSHGPGHAAAASASTFAHEEPPPTDEPSDRGSDLPSEPGRPSAEYSQPPAETPPRDFPPE